MIEISLIRHSLTEGNLKGRYIGTTDESLCKEGLAMLEGREYPQTERVYVSPMRRCMETAALIYPDEAPEIIEDFRECDFGDFENKNYLELADNPDYQRWVDSNGRLPFPGGESREEFTSRSVEAFCKLVENIQKRCLHKVAIIAHGGTIMSVMEALTYPHRDYYQWAVRNGEGYVLSVDQQWNIEKTLSLTKKIKF